jgi:hypothetical protein
VQWLGQERVRSVEVLVEGLMALAALAGNTVVATACEVPELVQTI